MILKKNTNRRRGRPKSAPRGLDLGTPEMQRHRQACLRLGHGAGLKPDPTHHLTDTTHNKGTKEAGKTPGVHPVLPIDLLYRRGIISQKSWENAMAFHRLRQTARAAMLAPHDLQSAAHRLKGRSCRAASFMGEWRTLQRWRTLCQTLSDRHPQMMDHMDRLLDGSRLMDYPYLCPDALQNLMESLETLSV